MQSSKMGRTCDLYQVMVSASSFLYLAQVVVVRVAVGVNTFLIIMEDGERVRYLLTHVINIVCGIA
jgi:hypothetical protein